MKLEAAADYRANGMVESVAHYASLAINEEYRRLDTQAGMEGRTGSE